MSILESFKKAVVGFLNSAKDIIIKFASNFLPKAGHLIEVAIEDVAEIAAKAVLEQAPKVISGQEKFGNAVTFVVQQVQSSGKTIAVQTAQAAVQIAYLEAQKIAEGK